LRCAISNDTALRSTTQLAIRFLDDVIEAGRWPTPQISSIVQAKRKVGLGVMGFAELLILLGIPYTGHQAVALADELMQFVAEEVLFTSEQLAEERERFAQCDPYACKL
jgi:ribonucleoside-diphosphate reductase alpha chain